MSTYAFEPIDLGPVISTAEIIQFLVYCSPPFIALLSLSKLLFTSLFLAIFVTLDFLAPVYHRVLLPSYLTLHHTIATAIQGAKHVSYLIVGALLIIGRFIHSLIHAFFQLDFFSACSGTITITLPDETTPWWIHLFAAAGYISPTSNPRVYTHRMITLRVITEVTANSIAAVLYQVKVAVEALVEMVAEWAKAELARGKVAAGLAADAVAARFWVEVARVKAAVREAAIAAAEEVVRQLSSALTRAKVAVAEAAEEAIGRVLIKVLLC